MAGFPPGKDGHGIVFLSLFSPVVVWGHKVHRCLLRSILCLGKFYFAPPQYWPREKMVCLDQPILLIVGRPRKVCLSVAGHPAVMISPL